MDNSVLIALIGIIPGIVGGLFAYFQAKKSASKDEMGQALDAWKEMRGEAQKDLDKVREQLDAERESKNQILDEISQMRESLAEAQRELYRLSQRMSEVEKIGFDFIDEKIWDVVWNNAIRGYALVNKNGIIRKANNTVCAALGYLPGELDGVHFANITISEDVQPDISDFADLIAGKIDHYERPKQYTHKNGEEVPGYLEVYSLGKKEYVLGVVIFDGKWTKLVGSDDDKTDS